MAGLGTFETSTDVRSTVAFRGNAGLTKPDNHRFMSTRANSGHA